MSVNDEICVVAFVPDEWHGVWGVRHQVLTRLSRHYRVLWVPPNPGWRQAWGRQTAPPAAAPPPDGLTVFAHSRRAPECFRPRALARHTRRKMLANVLARARQTGSRRIVVYVWRPQFAFAIDGLDHDLSLYHIDDEYSFSTSQTPLSAEEERLIRRVDRVFIHSPGLLEKKGGINEHTVFVPNGVDFRAFAEPVAEPADLAGIAAPRIGYVGVVKKQLDLALMLELARRHGDWSFVFVGPLGNVAGKERCVDELRALANVHLLGGKPAGALPGYVQHVDVCTMGYEINAYTHCIYPLKLHEYLAAGKPVVSSPIRTVTAFGDVVDLAETPGQWSAAIERNLAADRRTDACRAARQAVAREHDWDRSVGLIVAQIEAGLGT